MLFAFLSLKLFSISNPILLLGRKFNFGYFQVKALISGLFIILIYLSLPRSASSLVPDLIPTNPQLASKLQGLM